MTDPVSRRRASRQRSMARRNQLNKSLTATVIYDDLEVGDIILTRSNEMGSTFIRFGTASRYSHAMVYVGDQGIVHAEPADKPSTAGVKLEAIDFALADVDVAAVYRHSQANEQNTELVRDYLIAQLGKPYDTLELAGPVNVLNMVPTTSILGLAATRARVAVLAQGNRDAFFCSELVYAAYQHAGIPIASGNPSAYSPGDLQKSDKLFLLGMLKRQQRQESSAAERQRARHGRR